LGTPPSSPPVRTSDSPVQVAPHPIDANAAVAAVVGFLVLGEFVGKFVGESVGFDEGLAVGESVGFDEGLAMGESVGFDEGLAVGESVGFDEGLAVGESQVVTAHQYSPPLVDSGEALYVQPEEVKMSTALV
jgi:hypothetical protein